MTFKLKSGNKISFKDMGSSPAKQKVDPDAPGTPGKPGYEPPVRREDLDEKGKKLWDQLRKERKEPTWPGTDEYRKPEDIPAEEYEKRGIKKYPIEKPKKSPTKQKKGASVFDFDDTVSNEVFEKKSVKIKEPKRPKAKKTYQQRKEELLNQGFTQEDADQMIKHGATTGEYGATTDKIASAKPRKKK